MTWGQAGEEAGLTLLSSRLGGDRGTSLGKAAMGSEGQRRAQEPSCREGGTCPEALSMSELSR